MVGGSGFIGRNVVKRAAAMGWQVTSIGLSSQVAGELESQGVRSLVADIRKKAALSEVLGDASFEYVVNCGGYIDHIAYFNGGGKVFDTHFGGLCNLVELLNRQTLVGLVNIGSSDEYGNMPAPQREGQREAPISPYALSKLAATHLLQMLHRTEDFPGITLRVFLCYGPDQDERRFLPQIIRGCLENRSFPASEGRQLRDFCFIEDVVAATFAALTSAQAKGEVINIGSGQPVSIRQIIETVRDLTGGGTPLFGKIAYRRGENMELYPDISKAKSILGWKPQVALDQGLKETIQWSRDNP
ncbi:MAG TPA: NAD(P)-dependent oxidoreductase [Opitutaceae bacterium]|nr:NAD(P)-dependent oxidoreductase [Opitutaceae bacterium]